MPNLNMCSIQMSSKYILGIGLIASSLEKNQSRVREGAQNGVNEVYFFQSICFRTLESISL